jgi:hypothetical protein
VKPDQTLAEKKELDGRSFLAFQSRQRFIMRKLVLDSVSVV